MFVVVLWVPEQKAFIQAALMFSWTEPPDTFSISESVNSRSSLVIESSPFAFKDGRRTREP